MKLANQVGASNDLGELKLPSAPHLRVSPLDRLGRMAAVGAVAALLADPERQWAQAIEGPPPVIITLSARVFHHYYDYANPSNDQYFLDERFVITPGSDSDFSLPMKGTMNAGDFGHVATLDVTHSKSRLEFLFHTSLKGFRNYTVDSYTGTHVYGYVYVADPSYHLNVKWSATAESTRVLEDKFITSGEGSTYLWPWPEGIGTEKYTAVARYSFPSFSTLPHLNDTSTFSGEVPVLDPNLNTREYQGHRYYLTKLILSGGIKTSAGSSVVWGPRELPAFCSQDATVSMLYDYSILGGSDPDVKLEGENPNATPLVGSSFPIRAIAKDNDALGPNPQIRRYDWVNATSLPGDPSRAVVKPTHVGPLTVEVRVIDNEGKTATNKMNVEVEGSECCFYVDEPDGPFDPGHVFVGLHHGGTQSSNFVRGFYPAGQSAWEQGMHGFGWGGVVKDDSKHHWDYRLCYVIDEEKRKAGQQFIHDFAQSQNISYHVLDHSCIGLIEEVAKRLGLRLPMTRESQIKDIYDYVGLRDVADPWVFARSLRNALNQSPQFGDGTIERNKATGAKSTRRVAPMGGGVENGDMFGPITLLNYLASRPGALASAWGLRFDSRQLAPISITAGSTVTLTTPPRDITNSLSALWWSDSKSLEAQPTSVTKTFSTPGQYLVHFALVDNFEVWSADIPITVVAPSPTTPPPGEKRVTITPPSWVGQLDIQRFGPSQVRLFAPATGRELLLQRSPKLPFSDSLPWDPFGPSSILSLDVSEQGAFFRVRPGQ